MHSRQHASDEKTEADVVVFLESERMTAQYLDVAFMQSKRGSCGLLLEASANAGCGRLASACQQLIKMTFPVA